MPAASQATCTVNWVQKCALVAVTGFRARPASGVAPDGHTEACGVFEDRAPRGPYKDATETGGSGLTVPMLDRTDLEV